MRRKISRAKLDQLKSKGRVINYRNSAARKAEQPKVEQKKVVQKIEGVSVQPVVIDLTRPGQQKQVEYKFNRGSDGFIQTIESKDGKKVITVLRGEDGLISGVSIKG